MVNLLGTHPVHHAVELLEEEREALIHTYKPCLSEAPRLISWALQLLSTTPTSCDLRGQAHTLGNS